MIRWRCVICSKKLKAPDEQARRRGLCPRCGAVQEATQKWVLRKRGTLLYKGKTVKQWLKDWDTKFLGPLGVEDTMETFRVLGRAAIPSLIKALKAESETIRKRAAEALGDLSPRELEKTLSPREAQLAATALALAQTLQALAAQVHRSAASLLESAGLRTNAAVPALIAVLKDESAAVRRSAVQALASLGLQAGAAVPALIETLQDESAAVRMSAVRALGEMDLLAEAAIPALVRARTDSDNEVRAEAAEALQRINQAIAERENRRSTPPRRISHYV